ncbi:ATP-dependent zinc metalloprotease FtsH [Serpentinicella alkaliphila]|uniref:ATP-dependent zinc metalloprotease FtsH n=1 Tax=Serpentinicella alkaliphila TaxID=1734049 RepID=A0A4R2TNB3_9FIRM|nr:ATP-dependent zinc metalloprotease FtsH [Serpentinicella alkaliphila]QUH27081.1 ATP-dependent metallopeptidase FtsH/Yme1/Tma family protein [Serpentinicella alkaliphila]TCQ05208.1 membrane protease FtsH catalytic subunit [Serpentinicella alkaliphila]
MSKEKNNQKKPIVYFYITTIIMVLLLNAFVFPFIFKKNVTQVDYSTFLMEIEKGNISTAEIQDNQIAYIIENELGEEQIFMTGRVDDPDLVNRLYNADIQFSKVIPKQNSPLVNFILTWIFPILLFVAIVQMITKPLQKMMGTNNVMGFGKSNAKVYVEAQTGKTFSDVAGQNEAKEALSEIVDFLNNPTKFKEIGAIMPKGALLVGPPGTGKTLLAKAVAGEAKVPFFSISGSEFVEMFVGMGAARVRDLFKQAQEKAPCIIFIDEIDTIGKKRDNGGLGGNDEREQTLNQLLTEMDGFSGEKGVVILAATNRPESLDKALLRPGRFDRRVPVELPDLVGRESILKVHAKKIKFDSDVDFNGIARATSGASGAELANIINEGALRAVRCGRNYVIQSDLEEAVEVVIAGYQRKGAVISPKEKQIIAYHEIGHAIVAAKQMESAPVHKITIVPRTSGALGYTMQVAQEENVLMTKEEAFNKITTFTGGRAAEELVFGTYTSGASNDIEQATKIARMMVTRLGMSRNFDMMVLETVSNQYLGGDSSLICSPETASKIDEEVLGIIKKAHEKAINILKENMDKLHQLSRYLIERETITGEEFMRILLN